MNLAHTVYAQLPDWARPDHPVLRHVLRHTARSRSRAQRWTMRLAALALALALLWFNRFFYDLSGPIGMREARDSALYSFLYFPLTILQLVALAFALLAASNALVPEQRRGTWEALKITSHGAELFVRARWAAVFYQLRWLLLVLVGARVIFAGQMVLDVMDYRGHHLDLYTTGITPDVSVTMAVVQLAALLTAALLQLPALFGLNAALGLLIAAAVPNRVAAAATRTGALVAQVGLSLALSSAGRGVLDSEPWVVAVGGADRSGWWWRLFGMGLLGDQGLRLMDLETFLQTWADVKYAVLLGGALLAGVIAEVALARGLLAVVVRRATRPAGE